MTLSQLQTPGRPAVIAFLRHAGCPFAEATVRELRKVSAAHPGVEFVAVSHAPEAATREWAGKFGGWPEGVRLVSDESRALYAACGVPQTSALHWLAPGSTLRLLPLALRGIRNRKMTGTRAQSAGTFAVDASGAERFRHLPKSAGDLPDLEAAARAAEYK